jgi:hypothetical protein
MRIFNTLVFIVIITLNSCITPKKAFDNYASPDYSHEKNWASLPTKKDKADKVPKKSTLKNNQDSALADVFFLHYTTFYFRPIYGNAKLKNGFVNMLTDELSIKYQASLFNGSCKVYAPRYRQASIYSFVNIKKGMKSLNFAYEDVKNAFEYYLKNNNNGRPFIIASHSQGSYHAHRLIREYIDNNPQLKKQFVCAYIVGWAYEQPFSSIMPCDSASQIGCVNNWQTTRWNTKRKNHFPNKMVFKPSVSCVNPITWKRDTVYASRDKNLGGLPLFMRKIHPKVSDAQIRDNLLWVHHPRKLGYISWMLHYHFFDYNLFYLNVRENVDLRIKTHLNQLN